MSKAIRQQVVERLWEITEKLNILYKDNWTALADREMVKFQTELFAQQKEIDKNEGGGVLGMISNKISLNCNNFWSQAFNARGRFSFNQEFFKISLKRFHKSTICH